MQARLSRKAAISSGLVVAIIVVVIIVAASGSYFLLFNKSSTSSATNTSTSTTASLTSSTSSISTSTSTSQIVTQTGSEISPSTTSSITTAPLINSQYDLPYSSANHTVFLLLIPQKSSVSEENYNLTNFGAMKIYMPLGWNISISIYNNESTPHNVMIVQNSTDVPTAKDVGTQGKVLFVVGNTTDSYMFSGVPGGEEAHGTYTNNTMAGLFWMTCGVQSHGGAGMWAILVVSSSIKTPYVVVTNPVLTPSTV